MTAATPATISVLGLSSERRTRASRLEAGPGGCDRGTVDGAAGVTVAMSSPPVGVGEQGTGPAVTPSRSG